MPIYAYCRVSTPKQSMERQVKNIKRDFPQIKDKDFFCETWTGTTAERPEWKRLEKRLKNGDTVVFDSVSRMSRQAQEGFELYKRLYEKGVSLVFLKEPFINTNEYKESLEVDLPPVNDECIQPLMDGLKVMLMRLAERQFKKAFEQAEKEVEDLRQRTREGFTPEARRKISEAAKARKGRTLTTQKSKELKPKIKKLSKAFDGSFSDKEVIDLLKLAPNTFYKYKRELREELENTLENVHETD